MEKRGAQILKCNRDVRRILQSREVKTIKRNGLKLRLCNKQNRQDCSVMKSRRYNRNKNRQIFLCKNNRSSRFLKPLHNLCRKQYVK